MQLDALVELLDVMMPKIDGYHARLGKGSSPAQRSGKDA